MHLMGLDQGKRGLNNLSENIRKVCITNDKTVNLEAYQAGFKIGWSIFCSPSNGYQMGKKADLYKSFCPDDKEDLFREKFLIGKKVNEKFDQVSELEDKIKELTKATIRCIPLGRVEEAGSCVFTGKPSVGRVLFAKAY